MKCCKCSGIELKYLKLCSQCPVDLNIADKVIIENDDYNLSSLNDTIALLPRSLLQNACKWLRHTIYETGMKNLWRDLYSRSKIRHRML